MTDLAFTAGDFAVRLAETCSTLPTVSTEVENLVEKFNRYVFTNRGVCQRLNFYGKTTATDRGRVQDAEPKTVDDMLPPKPEIQGRTLGIEDSAQCGSPTIPGEPAVLFNCHIRFSPGLLQNANLITLHAGIQRVVTKLGESDAGGWRENAERPSIQIKWR